MTKSASNYFGFENPESWRCELSTLDSYDVTFCVWPNGSDAKAETQWIYFENLLYFEGPTLPWDGAHFEVDTSEEMLELIRSIWFDCRPWEEGDLADYFHAFVARTNDAPQTRIALIIAHAASIHPDSTFWNKAYA